jgi:hypothetical protein
LPLCFNWKNPSLVNKTASKKEPITSGAKQTKFHGTIIGTLNLHQQQILKYWMILFLKSLEKQPVDLH